MNTIDYILFLINLKYLEDFILNSIEFSLNIN